MFPRGAIVQFLTDGSLCRVCGKDGRRIEVEPFPGSRNNQRMATFVQNRDWFERAMLCPGTLVQTPDNQLATIIDLTPTTDNQTFEYRVELNDTGETRYLDESDIGLLPPDPKDYVQQALNLGAWETAYKSNPANQVVPDLDLLLLHRARTKILRERAILEEKAGETAPFLSARVVPLAHQIYTAMKVLTAPTKPRFVLADEVGLGKTIEAGLVVHALMSAKPDLKVLVIAPENLCMQWFTELHDKFGGRYFGLIKRFGNPAFAIHRQREEQIQTLVDRGLKDLDGKLIVSEEALRFKEILRDKLRLPWDVIIIDEAHHYPKSDKLHRYLMEITQINVHATVLALSATPSQKDNDGLLGLLQLVDPEEYSTLQPNDLATRFADKANIERILDDLRSWNFKRTEDKFKILQSLKAVQLESGDPTLDHWITQFSETKADKDREALRLHLLESRKVDQRILRTRRQTIQEAKNYLQEEGIPHLPLEIANQRNSILIDYSNVEEFNQYNQTQDRLLEQIDNVYLSEKNVDIRTLRYALSQASVCPSALRAFIKLRLTAKSSSKGKGIADNKLLMGPPPDQLEDLTATIKSSASEQDALKDLEKSVEESVGDFSKATSYKKAMLEHFFPNLNSGRWHHLISAESAKQFLTIAYALDKVLTNEDAHLLIFVSNHHAQEALLTHFRTTFQNARLQAKLGQLRDVLVDSFMGDKVEHRDRDIVLMQPSAEQFQTPDNPCRILISDESGGEGRNFQIADVVLHYDLPWQMGAVEQRIGRLDRVNRPQGKLVTSVVIHGKGALEAALLQLNGDAFFDTFNQTLGPYETLLPKVQGEILANALTSTQALHDYLATSQLKETIDAETKLNPEDRIFDTDSIELEEVAEKYHSALSVDTQPHAIPSEFWQAVWRWGQLFAGHPPAQTPRNTVIWLRSVQPGGDTEHGYRVPGWRYLARDLEVTVDREGAFQSERRALTGVGQFLVDGVTNALDQLNNARVIVFGQMRPTPLQKLPVEIHVSAKLPHNPNLPSYLQRHLKKWISDQIIRGHYLITLQSDNHAITNMMPTDDYAKEFFGIDDCELTQNNRPQQIHLTISNFTNHAPKMLGIPPTALRHLFSALKICYRDMTDKAQKAYQRRREQALENWKADTEGYRRYYEGLADIPARAEEARRILEALNEAESTLEDVEICLEALSLALPLTQGRR